MSGYGRLTVRLGSGMCLVLSTISLAEAGGFALREQSTFGQGSSFAGMAAGGSLSSMFWNPATLSDVDGFVIEKIITGVIPFSDVEYSAPPLAISLIDEGDIGLDAVVPSGYGAYRINQRLVLGVGLNAPFGLATSYDDTSPIQLAGVAGTSKIFSMNLNPAASYQVTDWLAVALGAQLQFIDLRYTSQALPVLGVSSLEGDDIGFGLTAGIQLTPMPGTEIGIGYRSYIDHEIEGTLTPHALGVELDAAAKDFDLPDLVTLGLRQSITDRFRVMAGAEWSNWSRFDTVDLTLPAGTIPLGFEYEDGWFFSGGAEFDVTEALTIRGGIGYEISPLDDDNRTFRLPDSNRLWLSAGASYDYSQRLRFDAGYTFIHAEEADILSAAAGGPLANGPFTGEANSHVHIISAGLKFRFGGPPSAPPPQ